MPLPPDALGFHLLQLASQLVHLHDEILTRLDAVIAGVSVDAKIADQQRRDRIETECRQERAQAFAGDHGGEHDPPALRLL